uniref:Secreted protein n=1 Tax=Equus asinus asinus TaxID=83772 RepID=A0A8C4LBW9_EQUAS
MQQSGAAGGRGCALFPLLAVLFFQGECAGWLCPTSGRGGGKGRWSLFRFRVGGLRKAPTSLLGRKEAGGCQEVVVFS